jgi:lipopolysaccharide/colanic/teichoic acid biosynthesis glycosyltransferase
MINAQPRALSRQMVCLVMVNRIVLLVMLIAMISIAIVIATAIVIDSGFPVFFSQERLGQYGQRFWLLKFRKFPSTVGRNTHYLRPRTDDSHVTPDHVPGLRQLVKFRFRQKLSNSR